MKPAIDPILALTMKNREVAAALATMLPGGELSYYTGGQASEETRDEALMPLWEKLQSPDHPLKFTYAQWCGALRPVALPCAILDDIDALQGVQAEHGPGSGEYELASRLLDKKNTVSERWRKMKGQTAETKRGEIAALSTTIREIYAELPEDFKHRVCLPEALEERLQAMEANIHARFALNAAAAAARGTGK